MKDIIAIYARVSSSPQSIKSQRPDLEKWIKAYTDKDAKIKWFIDTKSGKTMDRPAWNRLQTLIDANRVVKLVCWRLDRLGRTASGLTKLFEELNQKKVQLVSIKEGIDLNTTAGRLIANVLASVAAYDNEVRTERIVAGQAVARAKGKTWGGSKKGVLHKHSIEQVKQIVKMKKENEKVSVIAKTVGINRPDIYRILKRVRDGEIKLRA